MLRRVALYLRHRALLVLLVGLVAVWRHRRRPPAPAATVAGTAGLLAVASGGEVAPDAFVWEPSRGAWADALWGRNVLFLAALPAGGQHDLFRARVRVTREGFPMDVRRVKNLTQTPLADERRLVARHRYVAFASYALGGFQGVTVLDLEGDRFADLPWRQRWLAQLDNWLRLGSAAGFARRELVFHEPPDKLDMELQQQRLVLALGDAAEPAVVTLSSAELNAGRDSYHAEAWAVPRHLKQPLHAVMDGLREVFGTQPADAFKAVLFDARGRWLRLRNDASTDASTTPPSPPAAAPSEWPPAPLSPLFDHPLEHEGQWRPASVAWLPPPTSTGADAAPYLVQTLVRPDVALPFSVVRMVAIDTRQLQLRIEAGFEQPRALTGPRGRGRIPKEVLGQTVAAFNGAFQTRHGQYGMVVDRRVLVPPKDGAATVAVDELGHSYLGTWTFGAAPPAKVVSLRQNLDPLIDDGVFNPAGRTQWGFPLDGGSVLTERSALCRTKGGFLIYGWGIELTAETLAKALLQAGCQQAMHLDMNPGHVGFSYINAVDTPLRTQLLAPEMSIASDRFVTASAKDFFYLVLRDHRPSVAADSLHWVADDGVQPAPRWLPAVYRATTEKLGSEVTLFAIAANRFEWDIRPGAREPGGRTADGPLSERELARVLVAISLGSSGRRQRRRGLVLNGVHSMTLKPNRALLVTAPAGQPLLFEQTALDTRPAADAAELQWWAAGGKLLAQARKLGPRRIRSAACRLRDGLVLIAQADFDTGEPVTQVLLDAGCQRVAELNRGRQLNGFVRRKGTQPPPPAQHDDTVLYGFGRTMPGEAQTLRGLAPAAGAK